MSYLRNGNVFANLVDTRLVLSPMGAFYIAQDAFTEYMESIGTDGPTALKKYNAAWVVSMNKLVFSSPIYWNETYTTETWISSKTAITMFVDTIMRNSKGDEIFHSSTQFCAIDKDSKRIRKVDTVGIRDEHVMSLKENLVFDKSKCEGMEKVYSETVRSTNIDYLHHTNNMEYIRFIMNSYKVSEIEERPVKMMQLNYLKQTHEGDILDIYRVIREDNTEVLEIRNKDEVSLRAYIER